MIDFGIVVDSASKNEYNESISFYSHRRNTQEYNIIGISKLDLRTKDIKKYVFKNSYGLGHLAEFSSWRKLRIISDYDETENLIRCFYEIQSKDYKSEHIDDCLPVYTENEDLLLSCNSSVCRIECENGLLLTIDVETLEVSIDYYKDIIDHDVLRNRLNLKSVTVDYSKLSSLMDSYLDGAYRVGSLCYVYNWVKNEFISPDWCKTLWVAKNENIKILVLNSSLEELSVSSYNYEINTIYLSKDTDIVVACSLVSFLIKRYYIYTKDGMLSKESLPYFIDDKISHGEYTELWEYLKNNRVKPLVDKALDGTEIIVY